MQQVHDALAAQQERVAVRLGSLTDAGWGAGLQPLGLERLMQLGHFPSHIWELDWSPREVAGHLRDSARIFTRRIERLRTEDRPTLPDFATDDPERLEDYRTTDPEELLAQLEEAQRALLEAVAAVQPGELDRVGIHEGRGEITLGQLLDTLPAHQHDHAEQLAALTSEAIM